LKIKTNFQHIPGCRGLYTGRQPIVDRATTYSLPLHYICLGCSLGFYRGHKKICKASKLSYFYIATKI